MKKISDEEYASMIEVYKRLNAISVVGVSNIENLYVSIKTIEAILNRVENGIEIKEEAKDG